MLFRSVAGAEIAGGLALLHGWLGWPPLPSVPEKWPWWIIALSGVGIVIGLSVLGLAIEGLAGFVERLFTRQGHILTERPFLRGKAEKELQEWYKDFTRYSEVNWTEAQRWIWTSSQAADEYARRRLRILVARNTVFNVFVLSVIATVLVVKQSGCLFGLLTFAGGVVLTAVFVYVWLDANRAYHRAVIDAGKVGGKG